MGNRLVYINIIAFFLILIPFTSAAFYTNLQDDWNWDTGTNYDGYIWDDYIEGDYGTIIEIRGEDWSGDDADAVCLDFDQQDGGGFDYCFYDSTDKECDEVSSTFNDACDQGCQGSYSGADIHITSHLDYDGHDVVYARMYFDCDESEGPYTYEDDYEWYYDYDARRTDCQSSGSDTFYHEAKDEYDENWDLFSTHYCSSEHNSYWGCATWDEETVYTPEDSFDEDPCKIKDGSEEGNECNNDNDCISLDCDGARTVYTPTCWWDGADDYNLNVDQYSDTCGGSGYKYSSADDDFTCSQYLGSAYVCDADLDEGNTNDPGDFCRKDVGESCSQDSNCWNDNGGYDCNSGYCSKCGDSTCSNGEDYSNCPQDCCFTIYDCTGVSGEMGDGICHSSCDGYQGCSFYNSATRSACDGKDYDSYQCVDSDTRVLCCEGTPSDCSGNEYCSSGSCLTCSTACDDQCQSSACYGTDPDCDENGDPTLECGDETDLAILDVIPIQVIPNVDMVKGKSGYVRVIVHNYGPLNATGQVNVTFDGIPLLPINATKFIANQTNESFDFDFKPTIAGNNKEIIANVSII